MVAGTQTADKKKYYIKVFIMSMVTFFVVSLPFTYVSHYFTMTEVRPAAVINPCFGFVFGPVGAIGCAVGNFFVDIISSGIRVALIGFFPQIMYGLVPWLMLRISKLSPEQKEYYRFDSGKKVLFFYFSIALSSILIACVLAPIFADASTYRLFIQFIFTNNVSMNCIFAIPFTLLLVWIKKKMNNYQGDTSAGINERLIVFFMLVECGIIFFIATIAYYLAHDQMEGIGLWNLVYYFAVITAVLFVAVQILFIEMVEKKIFKPLSSLAKVWEEDRSLAVEMCNKLYNNPSEIGDLSRAFLRLVDEIQLNVMKVSREKVQENGVNYYGISGGVAHMSFVGSLEEDDVKILDEVLSGIDEAYSVLEIDTEQMTFMTSKILQVLSNHFEGHKDRSIRMKNVNEGTKLILDMTGFSGFIATEEKQQ